MNRLIALHGLAHSGKDTVCAFIKAHLALSETDYDKKPNIIQQYFYDSLTNANDETNNSFVIAGYERFANPLKAIIKSFLGVDDLNSPIVKEMQLSDDWIPVGGIQSLTIRQLHCEIADAIKGVINQDIFATSLFERIKKSTAEGVWLINDMRFENELELCKANNCYTVKIIRAEAEKERSCMEFVHSSEKGLPASEFDYIIRNDGSLEELFIKTADMLSDANLLSNQYVKYIKEKFFF